MATFSQWVEGARPRTLPAAVSPILVGSGAAAVGGRWSPVGAVLALVLALGLQVGVNYANDYSDGIRGTDDDRVGPFRLTGSRAARPSSVRNAAFAALGVAAVTGATLVLWSGIWWLLAVGIAALAAAWFYTGGKRPYGYLGLGEVMVFIFFGLFAVMFTTLTQLGRINSTSVFGAVAIGLLAVSIMLTNNLRDIPTDSRAGKITLAVRLGDHRTRLVYLGCVGIPYLLIALLVAFEPSAWPALLALATLPLAVMPARIVFQGAKGRTLIPVLKSSGRLELAYATTLTAGLVVATALAA